VSECSAPSRLHGGRMGRATHLDRRRGSVSRDVSRGGLKPALLRVDEAVAEECALHACRRRALV
jgi:hypothetical protein